MAAYGELSMATVTLTLVGGSALQLTPAIIAA